MRVIGILIFAAALAACGADGEPVQPTAQSTIAAPTPVVIS